jgi:hypothetical protein
MRNYRIYKFFNEHGCEKYLVKYRFLYFWWVRWKHKHWTHDGVGRYRTITMEWWYMNDVLVHLNFRHNNNKNNFNYEILR